MMNHEKVTCTIKAHPTTYEKGARRRRSCVFVWVKDETVWENLINRKSRPYREYRKVIQPLLDNLGAKARWSQRAGCTCPCSPGFILDKPVIHKGRVLNIHVTLHSTTVKEEA